MKKLTKNRPLSMFEVLKPGLLTTVQDLGRYGYQQYGLTTAGAMDAYALQAGNLLVGNDKNAAGLEIASTGLTLKALNDSVIAICGADLSTAVLNTAANGKKVFTKKVPVWQSFLLRRGQHLNFENPVKGRYAYLTVAGGICVKNMLNSKSTYLKAALGGYHGRALKKGDIISAGPPAELLTRLSGRRLNPAAIPNFKRHAAVRVILGPQQDAFTAQGLNTFLSAVYQVNAQSDRMGCRLQGPVIQHRQAAGAGMISDATAPGAIQVPPDGQPIVLLADRQTTGGYAKIATVISVDLPLVAQLSPGNTLSFKAVEIEDAQALYIRQKRFFSKLQAAAGSYYC